MTSKIQDLLNKRQSVKVEQLVTPDPKFLFMTWLLRKYLPKQWLK